MIPPEAEKSKSEAARLKTRNFGNTARKRELFGPGARLYSRKTTERKKAFMKKMTTLLFALLLTAGLLAGCGGGENEGTAEDAQVSLNSLYAGWAETYHWTEDAANSTGEDLLLMNIEGETLESYYPGLAELATEQLVAKAPMMSSVVNEIVLAECATEEDAAAAAAILRERADAQAEGGAWYPESMEAWSNAQVLQEGTYVALIASSQYQEELTASFQEQFA